MKKIHIIWALVIAFVICTSLFVISRLNALVSLDETCKANWSQVLNQYQRRSDLIPNLVATVKGYATHEQDTLTQVIEARAKATQTTLSPDMLSDDKAMAAFMQNQGALSSALSRLMVVVEKYPELKANENFMALQSQLEGTENRIAIARKDYIDSVRVFNTLIRKIPTKWVVAIFSDMEKKATFDIEESKKVVPVVDFSK
ncbi:MAG: LemA family protein [Alphaproteobacteria bacterium]|nr:LemA family protein [Alphaproteobacteria bacterium]